MQSKLTDFFQKVLAPFGITREQAEDYSKTTINARIPNAVGLVGSLFVHNHYSKQPLPHLYSLLIAVGIGSNTKC